VRSAIVIEERVEVVPAAPIADDHRVDVGATQLRSPGPPEIVETDVLPTGLASLVLEVFGGALHPPPEGSLCNVDERLVRGLATDAVDGVDRIRETFRDRRLAVVVGLRALPDAEHHASVGVGDVVGGNAHDLVGTEPTVNADFDRDLLDRLVDGVEELLDFALGEPDFHSVVVGVVFEIHPVRYVCGTGHKPPIYSGSARQ